MLSRLINAAKTGKLADVKKIIEENPDVDINGVEDYDWNYYISPLSAAASINNEDIYFYLRSKDAKVDAPSTKKFLSTFPSIHTMILSKKFSLTIFKDALKQAKDINPSMGWEGFHPFIDQVNKSSDRDIYLIRTGILQFVLYEAIFRNELTTIESALSKLAAFNNPPAVFDQHCFLVYAGDRTLSSTSRADLNQFFDLMAKNHVVPVTVAESFKKSFASICPPEEKLKGEPPALPANTEIEELMKKNERLEHRVNTLQQLCEQLQRTCETLQQTQVQQAEVYAKRISALEDKLPQERKPPSNSGIRFSFGN